MTDVLTQSQRSYCMSRIKGKDTSPEMILRSALWARGYRYRLKYSLPGKPDIVFPKQRIAIFIDGCFWHKCPIHFQYPATRVDFWRKKIGGNLERDKKVNQMLGDIGWTVKRYWEHETRSDLSPVIEDIAEIFALKTRVRFGLYGQNGTVDDIHSSSI